ncbi:hypothetical protein DFS34DRAFT_127194 [Phlyctochytrium arcticum]|nr:hypothetical protein DFS34DRAFT_127194 [Phlyctochytrium arcticum]
MNDGKSSGKRSKVSLFFSVCIGVGAFQPPQTCPVQVLHHKNCYKKGASPPPLLPIQLNQPDTIHRNHHSEPRPSFCDIIVVCEQVRLSFWVLGFYPSMFKAADV